MNIKLVVGLGNPGKEYEKTRHNSGFILLDQFTSEFRENSKNSAEEAKLGKVIYVKPQTFMNNSGQSVAKYKNFYKFRPEEIVVIHDEVDLSFGTIRMRKDGSSAGHKGVESIIKAIKSENFWRIRVGIGKPKNTKAMDRVLKGFSSTEIEKLRKASAEIQKLIENPSETTLKF